MCRPLSRSCLSSLLVLFTSLCGLAQSAQLGTMGTRFWAAAPQGHGAGPAIEHVMHISGAAGTTGTVSVPVQGWQQNYAIPASGTVMVPLPTLVQHFTSGVVEGKGILVESSALVGVVLMYKYPFATEASVILPEVALSTNYRALAMPAIPGFGDIHRSQVVIVAAHDDTELRITTPVPLGGPSGTTLSGTFSVFLDAGQSYQVQTKSPLSDLSGLRVEAADVSGPCRTFAVFTSTTCSSIPVSGPCASCNPLFDQAIPTSLWGSSYHFIPMGDSPVYSYRIMALENGTQVSLDGAPPTTLQAGQFLEATGVQTLKYVHADKPVSAVQFHEGTLCSNNAGDPNMFSLLADEVTTRAATLTALMPPGTTTGQWSISLVTTSAVAGLIDLNGNPIPASSYHPYAGSPGHVYASINVPLGTHRLTSTEPFLSYMVFRGQGDAYVYPGSESEYVPEDTDTLICNTSAQITVNSPIYLENAQWTSTATGTVIGTGNTLDLTLTSADTLVLTGTLPVSGCPQSFNIFVGQTIGGPGGPVVEVTADGANGATICQYGAVDLASQPAFDPAWFDLQWTPATTVNDPHAPSTTAFPMADTWYRLDVNSITGCGSGSDSVLVHVTPNDVYTVETTTDDDAICLGNTSQLGLKAQRVFRSDRFESAPATWWTIQGGTLSDLCGSVSGTALYFNGAGNRSASMSAMDLSMGGGLHFALKVATGTAPCDDADPGEHVVVEYSLNGTTWTNLSTLHENAYPVFSSVHVDIPALSANTRLRIRQLAHSGANQDNWTIDDVVVTRYSNTGLSMTWTPAETLTGANSSNPIASPTVDTWYTGTATSNTGCSFSDQAQITVGPTFNILPIEDTVRCSSSSIQLQAQATSGSNIQWSWTPANGSLSATNISDPIASPAATTAYTVSATNELGCTDSEQLTIGVSQLSSVTVSSPDLLLCQGESTQLSAAIVASGPIGIQWSPSTGVTSPNSASTSVQPATTTTYHCTVTDLATGCSIVKDITVTVTTAYSATLPNDTTLCSVLGLELDLVHNVPGSPTYSWSNPQWLNAADIEHPTIMEDTSATWTVTITDGNGCSVSASTTLTVAFDNLVTPVNVGTCEGQPMVLDAEFPGCIYEWTTTETTQTITVEDPGPYTVMITDAQLCQVVKTFIVSFHALPDLDLGDDLALCGEAQHTLQAGSPGTDVLWNTGATGQQLIVTATGDYWATATTGQGCTASDTVHISLDPAPVDVLQDITACVESPPTLDAGNPGSTYLWSTGATTQTIQAPNGPVSVTVTTPANCVATFDALVTLMPMVVVDLGVDTTLCMGQPLTLDAAHPGHTYTWNTGGHDASLPVSTSGTYSVVVSNGHCSGSDQVVVQFDPIPTDVLGDVTSCIDQPVLLDAGNPGSTYLWSDGSTDASITVNGTGTYSVQITNAFGCGLQAEAQVDFVPYPVVDLGIERAICQGGSVLLDAGNPTAMHQWSNQASTSAISVGTSGTYWVAVDNGHCTTRDTVTVRVDPVPDRLAQRNVMVCLDEPPRMVLLDAGNPGARYSWSTGDTTRTIEADQYGMFLVVVTNSFGCSLEDQVVVVQSCIPTLYLPNTFTPNDDGRNDTWVPVGRNIGEIELTVFDRWGSVIFHSTDPEKGWDGSINGKPAMNDLFAWKLRWRPIDNTTGELGFEREQVGHVQIMR